MGRGVRADFKHLLRLQNTVYALCKDNLRMEFFDDNQIEPTMSSRHYGHNWLFVVIHGSLLAHAVSHQSLQQYGRHDNLKNLPVTALRGQYCSGLRMINTQRRMYDFTGTHVTNRNQEGMFRFLGGEGLHHQEHSGSACKTSGNPPHSGRTSCNQEQKIVSNFTLCSVNVFHTSISNNAFQVITARTRHRRACLKTRSSSHSSQDLIKWAKWKCWKGWAHQESK